MLAPVRLTGDGRAAEREMAWFKRALREAARFVELREYSATSNRSPVEDIYDELHNHVRNRIFHAKDGLQPFLPQDIPSRAQVAEVKKRDGRLYLELAEKVFHARFPSGGTSLSNIAAPVGRTAVTKDWRIAFTTDPAPVDKSKQELSPSGEAFMTLPASQCIDPRGDDFTAIMARAEVPKIAALLPAIGRIGTVNTTGQLGLVASLGGRLTLAGLDCCEFVVSIGIAGRQTRKTTYAT